MGNFVFVREVGLRDGLQLVRKILPTELKLKWLKQQTRLNFKEIEVTSFVPKHVVPLFFDCKKVIREANLLPEIQASVLVPNYKGAVLAVKSGARKINYVISASESHNLANVKKTIKESMQELSNIVRYSRSLEENFFSIGLAISTSFGCSIEGNVDPKKVLNIATEALSLGVEEITVADTVGYANPKQVEIMFKTMIGITKKRKLYAHFHDTRGLALANVISALSVGVRHFDSSMRGLGGCPFAPGASGNVATEDLIFLLNSIGIETGINLTKLLHLSGSVGSWLPNEKLESKVFRAGLPAFYS